MTNSTEMIPTTIKSSPLFSEVLSGRGENENGFPFSFHTYTDSNGNELVRKFERYNKLTIAEKRFNQVAGSEMDIVEQDFLVDPNGVRFGSRAVLQSKLNVSKSKWKLLIRNGLKIYIVETNSIATLKDYEKEYPQIIQNLE